MHQTRLVRSFQRHHSSSILAYGCLPYQVFLAKFECIVTKISGCASATYQAPRLIQSIAQDRAVRGLELFEVGVGGSNIPLRAIILCGFIALVFILIGNLKGKNGAIMVNCTL